MTAITLAQVKDWLRYEASETEQDDTLTIMLRGAQNWVERHTGHILVQREVNQAVPAFGDYFDLSYFPYVSGLSIAYRDTAGDPAEIDDALASDLGGYFRVYPGSTWPSAATVPSIVATYTAGYADPDDAPAAMIEAMCLIVSMTDEERGGAGESGAAWKTVEWLLESYRKPALA